MQYKAMLQAVQKKRRHPLLISNLIQANIV